MTNYRALFSHHISMAQTSISLQPLDICTRWYCESINTLPPHLCNNYIPLSVISVDSHSYFKSKHPSLQHLIVFFLICCLCCLSLLLTLFLSYFSHLSPLSFTCTNFPFPTLLVSSLFHIIPSLTPLLCASFFSCPSHFSFSSHVPLHHLLLFLPFTCEICLLLPNLSSPFPPPHTILIL